MNALSLSNSEELALLASVGNEYHTGRLQRAAVLHEKSIRPPWQPKKGLDTGAVGHGGKGTKHAFLTGVGDEDAESEHGVQEDEGEILPEEMAAELHEAYVAQESAVVKLLKLEVLILLSFATPRRATPTKMIPPRSRLNRDFSWLKPVAIAQGAGVVDIGIRTASVL